MRCTYAMQAALLATLTIGLIGCGTGSTVFSEVVPAALIPADVDCWATSCGQTKFSFCDQPIPANFFDPGSQPFDGVIQLEGASGEADTKVERLQDMLLPDPGSTATTPIELVELNLVSCAPINVMTIAGMSQWDVHVDLSPTPSTAPGQLTVDKNHMNAGTYGGTLAVMPRFTFTDVNTSQVRVFDTGAEVGTPIPLRVLGDAPWVHEPTPEIGATLAPGCGTNFAPGVELNPATGLQCCREIQLQGGGFTLVLVPGLNCIGCDSGACCFGDGSCEIVSGGAGMTAAEVCASMGGQYKGDGSDCDTDTDMDGIPDHKENNDPCGQVDPCNFGTSASNPDSDGDGIPDGTEVLNGSDPLDPADPNR